MKSYNPVANKRKKVVKNVLFQIFAVIVGIVIISPIIYAFFYFDYAIESNIK